MQERDHGNPQVVLNFITPHQKWGIHSTYTDNLLMLTLKSEEHTSELQPLMRISYAVFCLKNKTEGLHHGLNNILNNTHTSRIIINDDRKRTTLNKINHTT